MGAGRRSFPPGCRRAGRCTCPGAPQGHPVQRGGGGAQGQKRQPDRHRPHRTPQRPAAAQRLCRAAGAGSAPLHGRHRQGKKADILLRIIGIGTELHARDLEIKALYDKRTFTGQLASQKKHFAEELLSYPDAPEQPVSASDLIRQQQDILARNGENQRKRAQLASLEEKAQLLAQRVQLLTRDLEAAEHALRAAQDDLQDARKSAEQLQDESTAALEASIRDIEETNRKVRANLEKARAEDEAAQYTAEYDQLTEAIAQKRADRMALLNGADLPLPGLGVEDGTLTYNGKHWRDMSGSDQLRVAAAIVRRLNPDCGFVLLDKLEQMDMDTLRSFAAWLEAEGLQAIATRVSTGSECQIIIEDGMVKDAEATQPPVTEKPQPKSWTKGAF